MNGGFVVKAPLTIPIVRANGKRSCATQMNEMNETV